MNEEIHIRQYRPDDVDALHEAIVESFAELTQRMVWCHADYSINDTQTWVAGRLGAWETDQAWDFLIVNQNDRILGAVGMHRLDLLNGVAEAGYWVRTAETGCSVATRGFHELCVWAFTEREFHRLEVLTTVDNAASQRVAEKVGAQREGLLRQRLLFRAQRLDAVLLSITKTSFGDGLGSA